MKRICVFCGSSPGARPDYVRTGQALGTLLARNGIGLVYGGANVGVMGALAEAVLGGDGEVIGVIPHLFAVKVGHDSLSRLEVVEGMHERKARMYELSDAFIALPGGTGTLEEFLEAMTWLQLGYHGKPCGILNVCGFYDEFLCFLDRMVDQRFLKQEHRDMILVEEEPEELVSRLRSFQPVVIDKWMDRT